MHPIIYDSGIYIQKLYLIWIVTVLVALIAFTWGQSYGMAKNAQIESAEKEGKEVDKSKKWGFWKITGAGLVFAIVGGLIAYFVYSALGFPKVKTFDPGWPIRIYAYGLMLTIAFIVGTIMTINYAKKYGKQDGITSENILDIIVFIIIGAIIGARLMYVALKLDEYLVYDIAGTADAEQKIFNLKMTLSKMIAFTQGGLSVHGGVLGAMISAGIYTKAKKLPYWKIADLTAPAIALGAAIGRIGCFLNGCCYGIACKDPTWYTVIFQPSEHSDVTAEPRHPAQLYMMVLNIIVFLLIRNKFKTKKFDGHVFLLWLGYFAIARFIQEFSRYKASSEVMFKWFTVAQVASFFIALIAIIIIAEMKKRVALSEKLAAEGTKEKVKKDQAKAE
jgi:phosphatidylglycerol:prolipoprotein diacylglycerol transferase